MVAVAAKSIQEETILDCSEFDEMTERYGLRFLGVGPDGVHRYEGSSISGLVLAFLDGKTARNNHNMLFLENIKRTELTGRSAWGNYYTEETLRRVLVQPPDLMAEIMKYMELIKCETPCFKKPGVRRLMSRGREFGEEIDSDRYLMRTPYVWSRNDREVHLKRTVNIGINLSANCSIVQKQMFPRGAACLALCEWLTQRGYNVGITAYECCTNPTEIVKKMTVKCVLKRPQMPLDVASISFAMCDIAFMRFGLLGGIGRQIHGLIKQGFGCPEPLFKADAEEVDFFINDNVLSEYQAVKWLERTIKKLETERQQI